MAERLQSDLCAEHTSTTPTTDDNRRRSNGNTSLRRGKPNTVTSGLPPDRYLPSPDRSRRSCDGEPLISGPVRQSSQREIFASPERRQHELCCDAAAFDTSPILKTDNNPIYNEALDGNTSMNDTSSVYSAGGVSSVGDNTISRQLSTVSIVSMASDFDCAFLHESFADQPEGSDAAAETITVGECVEESFKKPSVPVKMIKTVSSASCDKHITYTSKTSIPSPQTEDIDGQSVHLVKAASETDIVSVCAEISSTTLKAAASLDSVVQANNGLNVTTAYQSDSTPKSHALRTPRRHTVQVPPLLQIPNLPLSSDMQQMLLRTGMLEGGDVMNSHDYLSKSLNTQSCSRESVANLLDSNKGTVASNVKRFSDEQERETSHEHIARKHASPLRFTQPRQRGTSPIRIPTIFSSADSATAEHYRNLVQRPPGNTSVNDQHALHKAKLPISTTLLRSQSVECAKQKLSTSMHPTEYVAQDGEAELHALKDNSNLETPKIKSALLCNEASRRMPKTLPMPVTPCSYKPASETPRGKRYRKSPIKPVKRLRGSPQSPKSPKHRKSPSTTIPMGRKHGLSPIPNHISEWNV